MAQVTEAAMIPLGMTLAVLATAVFSLVLAELAFARAARATPRPVHTLEPLPDRDD